MKLNEFIFSDGVIKQIDSEAGSLRLLIEDYCDNLFSIVLYEVTRSTHGDCVGLSIHHSKLLRQEDRSLLRLFDDDNECLLEAEFLSSTVERAQ